MLVIVVISALRPLTWLIAEWRDCQGGICAVSGTVPEWDFAIFWQAGRLASLYDFADIFDFSRFRDDILTHLHYDVGLSPFAYPPTALLVFAPLSHLSLGLAYSAWIIAGTFVLLAGMRAAGLRWPSCAIVLASPGFLYNLLLGQNGAFTGGLLLAALCVSRTRPLRAGLLGALLLIKPQMGLLLPAAWAGMRGWRAVLAAGIGFVATGALVIAIFGLQPWHLYVQDAVPEMTRIMNAPSPQRAQSSAITSFVLLRALGASVPAARLCLYTLTLAACAAVAWSGRRNDFTHAIVLTILLTLLIMPYGHTYDMVAYAAALALIVQKQGPSLPFALFWAWPALARDVTVDFNTPLTPLVILLAAIWAHLSLAQPGRDLAQTAAAGRP
jgi:hypothetical protein